MSVVSEMLDGNVLGSELAKHFGLNPRYFSKVFEKESLNKDVKITKFKHTVLVSVPKEAHEYIKNYTAVPLSANEDESEYEYVLHLTNKLKIGFWK